MRFGGLNEIFLEGLQKTNQKLNRQPFSPFPSSVPQNVSSATGAHSAEKPMGSFPFYFVRLICSFHSILFLGKL